MEESAISYPENLELALQLGGTRLRDEQRAFPKQSRHGTSTR